LEKYRVHTMTIRVEKGPQTSPNGHSSPLNPRQRHMARIIWRGPVQAREAAVRARNTSCSTQKGVALSGRPN
jgi:hypothetical protein